VRKPALATSVGMDYKLTDFGIDSACYDQIAADALDDEVLVNAPRQPDAADIVSMLAVAQGG
jgi:alcohol dehydrogenase class IV